MKAKYRALFRKLRPDDMIGENEVETTEVMKSISELPQKQENLASKESKNEHNAILQTLYDASGIKASFNHDKVEQPLLDKKIIREGANMIAARALEALKKSARERASHHISEPTWTGQRGNAGARQAKKETKREPGLGSAVALSKACGAPRAHILEGLKQLVTIRNHGRQNPSQSDEASRLGLAKGAKNGGGEGGGVKKEAHRESGVAVSSNPALEGSHVGLATELLDSDRKVAETILHAFLDPKLAGRERRLTTGQVLQHLASGIAAHHTDLFKSLLKQMCELSKPARPNQPGVWTLRKEFWPRSST